jgi:microcystin-dependent protein
MAGSISLSLSQQFDSTGAPLNGGFLYFYQAGTTTPQSAYQDSSLTIPWPNPIVLDSAGRIPAFYLADGQIKIKLTDSAGVSQVQADNLLVVGASSGSGTAPSVDATTVLATGDLKWKYGVSTLSGWVRANGRTIGSATSGATERANADCEDLFVYLWNTDASLSVSTGRGVSAAADWAANKNIALPDMRGRVIAGFDDMGNSAAGRLTTTTMTGTGIGATGGAQTQTLVTANLPPYTPSGSVTSTPAAGAASNVVWSSGAGVLTIGAGAQYSVGPISVTSSFTGTAQGGTSTAFDKIQPTMFSTIYIKL